MQFLTGVKLIKLTGEDKVGLRVVQFLTGVKPSGRPASGSCGLRVVQFLTGKSDRRKGNAASGNVWAL